MRGDALEGALASFEPREKREINAARKEYGGDGAILTVRHGNRLLLKNERHMRLPTFCFYMLVDTRENADSCMEQEVSGRMFTDFTVNHPGIDVASLPEEERPAVISIKRHDLFLERLESKLIEMGVSEDEIWFSCVKYFDMHAGGSIRGYRPLMELFCKDSSYKHQQEGRIVVDSRNQEAMRTLERPIEIGNLWDVAVVWDWYFPEGIRAVVEPSDRITEVAGLR